MIVSSVTQLHPSAPLPAAVYRGVPALFTKLLCRTSLPLLPWLQAQHTPLPDSILRRSEQVLQNAAAAEAAMQRAWSWVPAPACALKRMRR